MSTDLQQRRERVLEVMQTYPEREMDVRFIHAQTRTREQIIAMQDSDLTIREVSGALRSLEASGEIVGLMRYYPQGTVYRLAEERRTA